MDEEMLTRAEKRRRRRVRRRVRFIVSVLMLAVVVVAVAVVCVRFIFVASDITVINETPYDTSELMAWTDYHVGDSLFSVDKSSFEKIETAFPYVKSANVSRRYFSNPVFTFLYAKPVLVFKADEQYLVLDKDYKILEITDAPSDSLPLVVGLEVDTVKEGTSLSEKDNIEISVLSDLIYCLQKNEWFDDTDTIDFSRVYNVTFTVHGNLTVELGTSDDLEKKIEAAKYVADRNDPERTAKISVRNYFSPRYALID